jgi:hypothetical protein
MALPLVVASVGGQEAFTASVTVEPQRVTVGDRITLSISIEHDPGVALEAPDNPEAFAPLDLVDVREPETGDVGDGRSETRFEYELAAFVIGEIDLEPLSITEDGAEVLRVEPALIMVDSVVPPDAPVQFRDLKAPLQASTGPPKWIWAALFMAGFAAVSVVTMALARVPALSRPPVLVAEPVAPEADARDVVLADLDDLEEAGHLDRGELLEYYKRLGDRLRIYLSRRFDVPATAMTPSEIERLLDVTEMNKLAIRQAVSTLEQCQAVQFAGYEPARERAVSDLAAVREIVQLTSETGPTV